LFWLTGALLSRPKKSKVHRHELGDILVSLGRGAPLQGCVRQYAMIFSETAIEGDAQVRDAARRCGCWRLSGWSRLAKPYPAPTASHVPALAVNTTVAMKITASIRDSVHAVGIWKWPSFRLMGRWITCV